MYDNSWGWGMGWGMWIIPLSIVLLVVYVLRYRGRK